MIAKAFWWLFESFFDNERGRGGGDRLYDNPALPYFHTYFSHVTKYYTFKSKVKKCITVACNDIIFFFIIIQ